MSSNEHDWSDLTPDERAAAFRAHHTGGMPYPGQVATPDDPSALGTLDQ